MIMEPSESKVHYESTDGLSDIVRPRYVASAETPFILWMVAKIKWIRNERDAYMVLLVVSGLCVVIAWLAWPSDPKVSKEEQMQQQQMMEQELGHTLP